MIVLRRALVDTSGFFAFSDPGDGNHSRALRIARTLAAERWALLTTNFVVAEAHALHLNRLGRGVARAFLASLDTSSTVVVRVTEDDERRGRAIVFRYADKDFSLTDATSFAVMERLGVRHAFTFDRHFEQYGFINLEA